MVSVIICTYDGDHEYLPKALASCVVQDVPTEVIVIDDGSREPLSYYVDKCVNLLADEFIINPTNLGLPATRNKAISQASHDLILPLDADDFLYPNVLGAMIKAIQDYDVVFGNITQREDVLERPAGKDGLSKELFLKINPIFSTSLFRKSAWEKIGGYDKDNPYYLDYNAWIKMFVAGCRFRYLDKLIYRHTLRDDSMLMRVAKETDYWNEMAKKPLYE